MKPKQEEVIERIVGGNLLGGFIADSKVDDKERLWVRIDNYSGFEKSGEITLIDKEKLKTVLNKINENI